ncbi:unnamed protein product [Rotaria sp. Silwood1]|nr:unnamed protein product [Rotaria sp. Silwood1]
MVTTDRLFFILLRRSCGDKFANGQFVDVAVTVKRIIYFPLIDAVNSLSRRRTKNYSGQSTINKQISMDGCLINSDQQKYLLPITPSSLPISRQGSLDSRIEEILENNSMDNKSNNELLSVPTNSQTDLTINVPKIIKEKKKKLKERKRKKYYSRMNK